MPGPSYAAAEPISALTSAFDSPTVCPRKAMAVV